MGDFISEESKHTEQTEGRETDIALQQGSTGMAFKWIMRNSGCDILGNPMQRKVIAQIDQATLKTLSCKNKQEERGKRQYVKDQEISSGRQQDTQRKLLKQDEN